MTYCRIKSVFIPKRMSFNPIFIIDVTMMWIIMQDLCPAIHIQGFPQHSYNINLHVKADYTEEI